MNTDLKYYIYARKSSESEDRQVQSIDAQVDRLQELAADNGLNVVETLTESASAKDPGNRPVFEALLEALRDGQADAILCWAINRLARNLKDAAEIHWMLQKGIIKRIDTTERHYLPDDNALLLGVESIMANQFVRDLSRDVKRGNEQKLLNGWKPGVAPVGYINKLDDHTIAPDPDRFEIVRKMWGLAISGKYTRGEIYRIITDEWGFTTRKMGRIGGKAMASSALYKMFTNKFYAGVIQYNGKEWPGKHQPMITLEEFDLVQQLFSNTGTGSKRPQHHEFAYTGMIRCGVCGAMYTAETKTKHLKDGALRHYTFYHCTRRKQGVDCPRQKWIPEKELEAMINQELGKITILPIFREWAMEILSNSNDERIASAEAIVKSQRQRLDEITTELNNLTRMRYRDQVSDELFNSERLTITQERDRITSKISGLHNNQDKWIDATEASFDFMTHARDKFNRGGLAIKRDIFRALGQNFYIMDGKLALEKYKWLEVIEKNYPALEREYQRLEPKIMPTESGIPYGLEPVFSRWQGIRLYGSAKGDKLRVLKGS